MAWTYWSFYFGNANWPSDALWRVNELGAREFFMEWPIVLPSTEEAVTMVQEWGEKTG